MDEAQIKEKFTQFLSNKVESKTTVKQYLSKINNLEKWFIENKITNDTFNIWLDIDKIEHINSKLKKEFNDLWLSTNKQKRNWLSSPWNAWVSFNNIKPIEEIIVRNENFNYSHFNQSAEKNGLVFSKSIVIRFIASLLTKPFVILTGLSGSGKTKLAHSFATWICEDENQYCIAPVGADWTNREPLLGFPNALETGKYVKPDNGVLDLIIAANANVAKPYFLILDEMNLSHVERYFADFLSVMESNSSISLHSDNGNIEAAETKIPPQISLPKNLFIIGTVNIDETTYMFSPKVLDRANVIEFRVTKNEMENYLNNFSKLQLKNLEIAGASMAEDFVNIAKNENLETKDTEELNKALIKFFIELKKMGAEFGYRSASEIKRFFAVLKNIEPDWTVTQIIDAALMQKLLPKVHGSRRKLEPVLKIMGTLCLTDGHNIDEFIFSKTEITFADNTKIKYPLSLEKILRMYYGLIDNGFTSYAEA